MLQMIFWCPHVQLLVVPDSLPLSTLFLYVLLDFPLLVFVCFSYILHLN